MLKACAHVGPMPRPMPAVEAAAFAAVASQSLAHNSQVYVTASGPPAVDANYSAALNSEVYVTANDPAVNANYSALNSVVYVTARGQGNDAPCLKYN